MIRHTVAFRLRHDQDSAEEADFLAAGRAALTAIPGVQDFTVSRQVSPKSATTLHFSMVFADQATYDAYDEHPLHVGFVGERWDSEVVEFQELDLVTLG